MHLIYLCKDFFPPPGNQTFLQRSFSRPSCSPPSPPSHHMKSLAKREECSASYPPKDLKTQKAQEQNLSKMFSFIGEKHGVNDLFLDEDENVVRHWL